MGITMTTRQCERSIAMGLMERLIAGMVAAYATIAPAAGQTFDPSTDPVFQRAVGVNKGLKSFTAHIDVKTRVFFARFGLQGTVYRRGDQQIVVFDQVPAVARAAVRNMPTISGPGDWPRRYGMSIVARTDDTTTFRLTPLRTENVRSVDVVVSNASGLLLEYAWSNGDGQIITSDETYETIGGYELVRSSMTTTRGGAFPTESTTIFTDYALNTTVPGSILASTPPDP